jgi:hypothetical protein
VELRASPESFFSTLARKRTTMSNPDLAQEQHGITGRLRNASFLRRQLPYLAILVLAVAGVAYTNISHQPLVGYWEFLVVATGVMCVVTQWDSAQDRRARLRLLSTQALHWIAILFTMNMVLLPGLRTMVPVPAVSLVLLTLLALGAFLAGVSFLSPQICFLGLALALAVPAIAWLNRSALFLTLAAVLLIGLGIIFWPPRVGRRAAKSGET